MTQNTHDLTANKLILLFLLKNVSGPLSQTQITDFILFNNYTDYFSLQQYLAELVNATLIAQSKNNNTTMYEINQKGIDTLELFINRIPYSIRQEIMEFTKNNDCKVNLYRSIESNIKEEDGQYVVSCSIKENDKPIISLDVKTESEDEAKMIKTNWQKRARSIYKTVVKDLKNEN